MKKAQLRREFLKKRADLAPETVAEASRSIAGRFFAAVDLSDVRTVHAFISIPKFNEVDTSLIVDRIRRQHRSIRTVAPKTLLGTGKLEHIAFTARTLLVENSWGIREPSDGESVEPESIDLVIVPLLCFDVTGHRTGYGKGFYDGFLAGCRPDCRKVGVSLFEPVEEIDDIGDHDIRLDACITPEGVYQF